MEVLFKVRCDDEFKIGVISALLKVNNVDFEILDSRENRGFTQEELDELYKIAEENTRRDKDGNIVFDEDDWPWEEE